MKRREPPRRDDERPTAPPWIRQSNFGLRHFSDGPVPERLGQGPATARWREARDEWCLENGCHKVGKTCAELYGGNTCGAETRRPGRAPAT